MNTLEDLLRMSVKSETKDGGECLVSPDFRVAIQRQDQNGVHFIIHANGHHSDTLDFFVTGNTIRPI